MFLGELIHVELRLLNIAVKSASDCIASGKVLPYNLIDPGQSASIALHFSAPPFLGRFLQRSLSVVDLLLFSPMNALALMQRLVDARVHEVGGKNRSPVIDAINRESGLALGSPYCAATVSHCFRMALRLDHQDRGFSFPSSGSSQAIKKSFAALGRVSVDPQDLLSWRGALGGWTNVDDPAHGHIFFIKGRLTNSAGEAVGLVTLEANTSPQTQDRDGEGMYELHRSLDSLREKHPQFWFLRTDGFVGGEWW